jgi:hypothetical protein
MRTLGAPSIPPCREATVEALHHRLRPTDAVAPVPGSTPVAAGARLRVTPPFRAAVAD